MSIGNSEKLNSPLVSVLCTLLSSSILTIASLKGALLYVIFPDTSAEISKFKFSLSLPTLVKEIYAGFATKLSLDNMILQSIPAVTPLTTYLPFSSVLYFTPFTLISIFLTGLSNEVT